MTFYQAWEQALREMGMSDEEIRQRSLMADARVQMPKDRKEAVLPPDMERDCVDFLKSLYELMKDNQAVFKPIFERLMAERNAKN